MVNDYTQTWFELFLETRPFTQQETDFVIRNLPNPPYKRILDICCGQGRHTNLLARNGYKVVGVDLNEKALSIAQRDAPETVRYVCQDMRHLDTIDESFDAITVLWQSFGYFDRITNEVILRQIAQKLTTRGRLILDIYNRAYWENNQGNRQFEKKGIQIRSSNTMTGNRLRSRLVYGAGETGESFEWQLYYLGEIIALATRHGLEYVLSCAESDESKSASQEHPQMQIVFEKREWLP